MDGESAPRMTCSYRGQQNMEEIRHSLRQCQECEKVILLYFRSSSVRVILTVTRFSYINGDKDITVGNKLSSASWKLHYTYMKDVCPRYTDTSAAGLLFRNHFINYRHPDPHSGRQGSGCKLCHYVRLFRSSREAVIQ